ncbi:hypothetical protein ONS95_002360 [Cadophora gregata]|uniref:uncharacterized protein n=1 Tax=Cadophora gregata TaxID=51156 RepID=UPI0026DDA428|nr:uncharacterized protein ONS95_002360 [Cadophora gregata]KAK0109681.1 hypothetical protein ONS95_002360 [Cadophora gregata]KAK0110688.1 hypothetical protein ONS96_002290 [Cadophora gregata f. sp. sojae]
MTAIIYKNAWATDNRLDTRMGINLQSLEQSERLLTEFIDLNRSYQRLTTQNYEKYSDLAKSCSDHALNNDKLIENYGEMVATCMQLAGAYRRISENNEKMLQGYKQLYKEYGFMAMNLGYALGSRAE